MSASTTINRYLGSCSLGESQRPVGSVVLEPKYCEICGITFVREFAPTEVYETRTEVYWSVAGWSNEHPADLRRDHGERFCRDCRGRELQPDLKAQENYKSQLPNQREARRNRVYQMPDYTRLNPPRIKPKVTVVQ